MSTDWIMDGVIGTVHDDTIWIQKHGNFDSFAWLGGCAKVDEGTYSLGDMTITQKQNPRGGIMRDSVLVGPPGEATNTLTIKRIHGDRKRADLMNCFWNIDQRTNCKDRDDWNGWTEIIRLCQGKATERGNPGTAYDGDNTEQVFTFPWKALSLVDVWRVVGEIETSAIAAAQMFTAVTTCQPERCADNCDDQGDCVVVAVTESKAILTPYLAVNLAGGALGSWTQTAIAGWGPTHHALDVACAGSLIVAVSNVGANTMHTQDYGVTQVHTTSTDMTAHNPNCVDMIDQTFIVVGGDDAYMFASYDQATTWQTLDAGNAATDHITAVMIARDDPGVIYAVSSADDVCIKTENSGRTWYAVATTGTAGGLTALLVKNRNHVLVGTDKGELFETTDGGATWTEQTVLTGLTAKVTTRIMSITDCGCGDLALVTYDSAETESFFFRNVDGGASGKWFQPTDMEDVAADYSYQSVTCCGSSHFIAVGGDTTFGNIAMLAR